MSMQDERYDRNPFKAKGLDREHFDHLCSVYRAWGDAYWPGTAIGTSNAWVAVTTRPSRETMPDLDPDILRDRQQTWDAAAERFADELAAHVSFRVEREASEQAKVSQFEEERKARDDAALASLTDDLRRGYFSVPGATEQDFQADLPELLREARRKAALTAEDVPTLPREWWAA